LSPIVYFKFGPIFLLSKMHQQLFLEIWMVKNLQEQLIFLKIKWTILNRCLFDSTRKRVLIKIQVLFCFFFNEFFSNYNFPLFSLWLRYTITICLNDDLKVKKTSKLAKKTIEFVSFLFLFEIAYFSDCITFKKPFHFSF